MIMSVVKELLLFGMIENLFIILFFIFMNGIKEKWTTIALHVVMLSILLGVLSAMFGNSPIKPLFGILVSGIYLNSIYNIILSKKRWGLGFLYVFLAFATIIISQVFSNILFYNIIFHINIAVMPNSFEKFLYFLPIDVVTYFILYIIYKRRKKVS